jgi:hypothetical protein
LLEEAVRLLRQRAENADLAASPQPYQAPIFIISIDTPLPEKL